MNLVSLESIIDVGFVLLVLTVCFQSVVSNSRTSKKNYERWKAQLEELASILRTLIDEAAVASNSFDRSLLRRKVELQDLLVRIESARDEVHGSAQQVIELEEAKEFASEDFPNDTWRVSSSVHRPKRHALRSRIEITPNDTPYYDSQLTAEAPENEKRAIAKRNIEVDDPIVIRIAKRLLARGQEIHVVARKLELPIAEVRHLDAALRRELGDFSEADDLQFGEGDEREHWTSNEPTAEHVDLELDLEEELDR